MHEERCFRRRDNGLSCFGALMCASQSSEMMQYLHFSYCNPHYSYNRGVVFSTSPTGG